MKKIIIIIIAISLIVGSLFIFNNNSIERYIENEIGINIKGSKIITNNDKHEGFLNDGELIVVADCSNIKLDFSNFKKLPLTNNLNEIMYSENNFNLAKLNNIPVINNGYYYFRDRQNNSNDDKDLLSRPSYNFTFALYDLDTNLFYYYEIDT